MRAAPSFPGYSVTGDGRVFTHRRRFGLGKGRGGGVVIDPTFSRELRQFVGHGGYLYVSIAREQGQRAVPVHRLIMDAFVGPEPEGQEVRHLDGDCRNNTLSNLAYGTPKQNADDRMRCGVRFIGENNPRARVTEDVVRGIRARAATGEAVRAIARSLKIGATTVADIVKRKRWQHVA